MSCFTLTGLGLRFPRCGDTVPESTSWEHPCHFFDGSEETVRWIFTLDVLNHCFWPDRGKPAWSVLYKGEAYSGYWGLAAALRRAEGKRGPDDRPGVSFKHRRKRACPNSFVSWARRSRFGRRRRNSHVFGKVKEPSRGRHR